MDREQNQMAASLEEIRHLLSHLHGEVTALESSYTQVLSVLRKFEKAVDTDDLTGLLRRRAFFQTWETLLQECQRLNEACGVLMIDIDHFKHVNDTHGHPTGDEVIKRIASLLKQYESPSCIVSRLGGEEFAVALKEKKRMWIFTSTEATSSTVPVPCAVIVALMPTLASEKPNALTLTDALKLTPKLYSFPSHVSP